MLPVKLIFLSKSAFKMSWDKIDKILPWVAETPQTLETCAVHHVRSTQVPIPYILLQGKNPHFCYLFPSSTQKLWWLYTETILFNTDTHYEADKTFVGLFDKRGMATEEQGELDRRKAFHLGPLIFIMQTVSGVWKLAIATRKGVWNLPYSEGGCTCY